MWKSAPPVILVGQPDGGMVPQAGVPERLQFKRRNETAMIQVGPGLLVINHLRPCPSRRDFRGPVLKIYMQYQELNERLNVERVGGHVNQSFSAGRHPSAR